MICLKRAQAASLVYVHRCTRNPHLSCRILLSLSRAFCAIESDMCTADEEVKVFISDTERENRQKRARNEITFGR